MGNDGNYNHSVFNSACEMLHFYLLHIYGVEVTYFQTHAY
jgi:hypothetical protein